MESYADKLKKKLAKESSSLDEKTTNSLLGFLGTLDEEGNATTGQQIASSPFDPELAGQEYTINEVLQVNYYYWIIICLFVANLDPIRMNANLLLY